MFENEIQAVWLGSLLVVVFLAPFLFIVMLKYGNKEKNDRLKIDENNNIKEKKTSIEWIYKGKMSFILDSYPSRHVTINDNSVLERTTSEVICNGYISSDHLGDRRVFGMIGSGKVKPRNTNLEIKELSQTWRSPDRLSHDDFFHEPIPCDCRVTFLANDNSDKENNISVANHGKSFRNPELNAEVTVSEKMLEEIKLSLYLKSDISNVKITTKIGFDECYVDKDGNIMINLIDSFETQMKYFVVFSNTIEDVSFLHPRAPWYERFMFHWGCLFMRPSLSRSNVYLLFWIFFIVGMLIVANGH